MEMSDKTEEAEKNITEEKLSECNSKNLRCEVIIGSGNTLDDRKFNVGLAESNSVGVEMLIEERRNNELGEGESYVGCIGKTLESQIVTGGINVESNERISHVVTLVERGMDDQPGFGNRQEGPASPSCEILLVGNAEVVTTGGMNNQLDERDCQVGSRKLLCSDENESNELNECICTESSHLIEESTYEVHEDPQGEKNTQEETVATFSHSEKCFKLTPPSELQKSMDKENCTESWLEPPSMETDVGEERVKSELCGRESSISPEFFLCKTSVVGADSKCALLDTGLLSSSLPANHLTKDKPGTTCCIFAKYLIFSFGLWTQLLVKSNDPYTYF
jgi:hypothetical protein